jgi:hypothetical protein
MATRKASSLSVRRPTRCVLKTFTQVTERRNDDEIANVWGATLGMIEEFIQERAKERKQIWGDHG